MAKNPAVTKSFDAVIYYRGLGLICGRVLEIDHEGMFVDTGPVILHSDTPVEVALAGPGGQGDLHRLQALIAGASPQGVELRFHNLTSSMRRSLHKIVQDRGPTTSQEVSPHMETQPAPDAGIQ